MSDAHTTPPMRNGVTASKVHLPKQAHATSIYSFLCQKFEHISAIEWQQRFADGLILDANGQVLSIEQNYQTQQHIFYYRHLAKEVVVPFKHEILFENDHLMVVDKPHFLTMSPTGQYVQETLLVRLKQQTHNPKLTPIHRLDRETAGVVLFSKQPETRGLYQNLFAQHLVQKTYHAIAAFSPTLKLPCTTSFKMEKGQPFYTMQIVQGEPNSETQIELLEHNTIWAKYQLQPKTGKQHQLRVHLSALGVPILNDPLYPLVCHKAENDFSQPLQLLAASIHFVDPITQQLMEFFSQQSLHLPLQCNDNELTK
ncbi:pseudouridine synthase [Acinetobacter sp. MD2]|uniref:pseudouridine synthase n=1 Tax=Acinetobacter sp. MD2 TaxID=2600066 RepID=UPI002D1F5E9F|nr:pseudouridine synthase [Acinetobacter sp. MD2]MEB3766669.1 pseudouridylate synthase [Acinetobacter sp. MD2]